MTIENQAKQQAAVAEQVFMKPSNEQNVDRFSSNNQAGCTGKCIGPGGCKG